MFFFQRVKLVYVAFGKDCEIGAVFSEAKLRSVAFNGLHDLKDTSTIRYYASRKSVWWKETIYFVK